MDYLPAQTIRGRVTQGGIPRSGIQVSVLIWEPNGDQHQGYLINTDSDGRFVIDPQAAGDETDRSDFGTAYYFGTGVNCYLGAGDNASGLGTWSAQAFANGYSSAQVTWEVHWWTIHLTH